MRAALDGARDYLYDLRRFARASSAVTRARDAVGVEACITKDYHRIEKGLSLPEVRPGFGESSLRFLAGSLPAAEARFGPSLATEAARGALRAYAAHHEAVEAPLPAAMPPLEPARPTAVGGVREVARADVVEAGRALDFERFVLNRHSVRHFTGAPVEEAAIARAVALAIKSPCVCNRESRRVHAAFDPVVRDRMLGFQNGNRGFGHLAGAVLAVTSDMRAFTDFGERNQCWIDGGLFAMTLAYALHAQGLGVCMLNWSVRPQKDRYLRRAFAIPDHEAVITLMAVGHMPERFRVAASPRPEPAGVLRVVREIADPTPWAKK